MILQLEPKTALHKTNAQSVNVIAAWHWWTIPALLSFLLAIFFQDPFAGDWDALDYAVLAVKGHPSSMLFGRMLFIYFNHVLWLIADTFFNFSVESAYLLFKYAVIIQSPLAVVACWALAYELTNDLRIATISSLLICLSPFFITYSGQAMTEIPSILLFATALTIHIRGISQRRFWLILAGAALLGLSVNIREVGAILHAPWLIIAPLVYRWKLGRKELLLVALSCLVFVVFAFGGFAYWFLMDIRGYRSEWYGWLQSMHVESARHPVTIFNFIKLLFYFLLTSPLVLLTLPFALKMERQRESFSPLLLIAIIGFIANLLLVFNYSTVVNPRYLLTGLPVLAPLTAKYLWSRTLERIGSMDRSLFMIILMISTLAVTTGYLIHRATWKTIQSHLHTKDYISKLKLLPHDAVVMAGTQTVSVTFWRGLGAGNWQPIAKGSGWPGPDLFNVINTHLENNKRVFLDVDQRFWPTHGWHLEETRMLPELESRFRFRHVADSLYEIRPLSDSTAQDKPNLQRLLENGK